MGKLYREPKTVNQALKGTYLHRTYGSKFILEPPQIVWVLIFIKAAHNIGNPQLLKFPHKSLQCRPIWCWCSRENKWQPTILYSCHSLKLRALWSHALQAFDLVVGERGGFQPHALGHGWGCNTTIDLLWPLITLVVWLIHKNYRSHSLIQWLNLLLSQHSSACFTLNFECSILIYQCSC